MAEEQGLPGLVPGPRAADAPIFAGDYGATGPLEVDGAGGSAFGWSDAATGALVFTGTDASAFGWSDAASGALVFKGSGGSAFGWSSAGTGATPIVPSTGSGKASQRYRGYYPVEVHQVVEGRARSAFGFSVTASGQLLFPRTIVARGGSRFVWRSRAHALLDDSPLKIAAEDRALLFGEDELDL